MTQDKQRLVAAILNFLANEKEADADSLAVASQVISDTYRVNTTDAPLQLPSTHTLLDVFNAGIKSLNITFPEPVEDLESNPKYQAFLKQLDEIGYFRGCNEEQRLQRLEKAKEKFLARTQASKPDPATAEKFKTEGNEFLKQKKYNEAIESYKNAIKSDPTNAIYPANMAAAYLQINDLDNAEKCCKKAIEIDQKYTKSYTRLALIYQRRGKTEDAVRQYELALEQEPNNQEYRQKLEELRSSSRSAATRSTPQANPFGGMGGLGGLGNLMGGLGGNSGGGMPDFGQLGQMLNNPQFMEMAMNMMQRPEMQSMVQNMMQGMGGQSNGGDDASNPFGGMDAAGIERVLQEPEVQNSPKLTAIFEECREKGISHALQYITDPEVSTFMRDYAMRQLQNLPADQNPFASFMPPSQNNGDEDNDNSGSMYS